MSDVEPAQQPESVHEKLDAELATGLARPAIETTFAAEPLEITPDHAVFGKLVETGTLAILERSIPPAAVTEWVNTVREMPTDTQIAIAGQLQSFYAAVGRYFEILAAESQDTTALPNRRTDRSIASILRDNPELGEMPVFELPSDAKEIILSTAAASLAIGDILKLLFQSNRVHPKTYAEVWNLLIDLAEIGLLTYDATTRKYRAANSDTSDSERPPAREETLNQKLFNAGITSTKNPGRRY